MAINKGEMFTKNDLFIDYPFEKVMYRWDCVRKKMYMRFYGEGEKQNSVPPDSRLVNEAILYGKLITREQYENGVGDNG
jgi:hypothetical protein